MTSRVNVCVCVQLLAVSRTFTSNVKTPVTVAPALAMVAEPLPLSVNVNDVGTVVAFASVSVHGPVPPVMEMFWLYALPKTALGIVFAGVKTNGAQAMTRL